jgi:hypothetical protein
MSRQVTFNVEEGEVGEIGVGGNEVLRVYLVKL